MAVEGFDLTGKKALVVGGGSSAGRAIALALAEAGAQVAVTSVEQRRRRRSGCQGDRPTARERRGATDRRHVVSATLPAPSRRVVRELGSVDILVNCPDLFLAKPIEEISDAELERVLIANLNTVFFACRAAGPQMAKQGFGRIINVASGLGERGLPNCSAYCAAKGAVFNLTRALAQEWAANGVTVNVIAPAWMEDTPGLGRPQPGDEPPGALHPDAARRKAGRDRAARHLHRLRGRRLSDGPDRLRRRRPAGAPLEMPFAEINGFKMHYQVRGEGPPLVIAHGLLSSMAMAELLGEVPAALFNDFTVVTYDSRGHGESGFTTDVVDYRVGIAGCGHCWRLLQLTWESRKHTWAAAPWAAARCSSRAPTPGESGKDRPPIAAAGWPAAVGAGRGLVRRPGEAHRRARPEGGREHRPSAEALVRGRRRPRR